MQQIIQESLEEYYSSSSFEYATVRCLLTRTRTSGNRQEHSFKPPNNKKKQEEKIGRILAEETKD